MSNETITKIGNDKLCVDFSIDAEKVDEAIENAERLVAALKERPLGKKQLGDDPEQTTRNAVLSRATRAVAERAIKDVIESRNIRLTSNPKTEIENLVVPGTPYLFSIELDIVPEYDIVGFDDLVVTYQAQDEVSDEDVERRLGEIQARSAEVERDSAKPIDDNYVVELSFESFIDGEPYEGSVAEGYTYTMGSGQLPDAFEEGLRGLRTGDERSIEFEVPNDYANSDIAGKTARFDVTVGRVAACELPEINDEFAKSFGYESLEFWREKIRKELAVQEEREVEERREKAAREALADCLKESVPADLINARAEQLLQAFKQDLSNQGTSFEEYCRFLGLTERDVRDEMREESAELVRENLALEALFRSLGYELNDEEIQKTVTDLAEESGAPLSTSISEFNQEQQMAIREMTMHRMATEWLMSHAKFIEATS